MPDAATEVPDSLPLVSVVIAVRDGAGTVADCIDSLLALRYPGDRREVIIVDNGSTDDTLRVLSRFGGSVRVLQESRRGAAAARNRGIREANGSVIAFTDADAVVDPGWLNALVGPVQHQATGAACGPILSKRPGNRIQRFGETIHDQQKAVEERTPPYLATGNWASRRDVLINVGLFDETLMRGQDVDLAFRLHLAGYRLAYCPDATVYHLNEGTILGLLREGYLHGIAGVMVREKHANSFPVKLTRSSHVARRLLMHAATFLRGGDRVKAALNFVFDSGKLGGELVALMRRPAGSPPPGVDAAGNA